MGEFHDKVKASSDTRLSRLQKRLIKLYVTTLAQDETKAEKIFGRSREVELELEARARSKAETSSAEEPRSDAKGRGRMGK